MTRRIRVWTLIAAGSVLLAAACSSGDSQAVGTTTTRDLTGATTIDPTEAPAMGIDHWHAAYGVYICDQFLPALTDQHGDRFGIHTHDDGLIHIHPFSIEASGPNATIDVFGSEVDLSVSQDALTTPRGEPFVAGQDCNGQPGVVQVARWRAGELDGPPEITVADPGGVRFLEDGEVFTIAFAPLGAPIPLPPSVDALADPGDLAG
jgi:hypothetical protein